MREMSKMWLGRETSNGREHEVLKVTLKDGGEQYALDLAGAQYGYYEPAIPWEEYVEARVENFIDRPGFQYFGGYKKWIKNSLPQEDDWHFGGDLNKGLDQIHIIANESLKEGTKKWEQIQKMSVQKLLRLPAADFDVKQKELIQVVRSATAFCKKFIGEKMRGWARALKTEEGILTVNTLQSLKNRCVTQLGNFISVLSQTPHNTIKTVSQAASTATATMTQISAYVFDLFRYSSIPILVLSKTEPGENEGEDGEYPADDRSGNGCYVRYITQLIAADTGRYRS
jgi:hypothetical protein